MQPVEYIQCPCFTDWVLVRLRIHKAERQSVLGLAGAELIFFPVTAMGLCFGLELNIGLVIQRCVYECLSRAHIEPRPFLLSCGWG